MRTIIEVNGRALLSGAAPRLGDWPDTATEAAVSAALRRHDPMLRRALMTATGLSRWASLAGTGRRRAAAARRRRRGGRGGLRCLLQPRALFERLGGFDEGYFLHCEDLDLCRHVRDAGCRVVLAATVDIAHAQGSSSRHRPLFVARHKRRGL